MSLLTTISRLQFALVLLLAVVAAQTCYYPDRTTISKDIRCSSGDGPSACCPQGSFCMSSGLCFVGSVLTRGSCTDQTWNSPECFKDCRDSNPSGPSPLTPCGDKSFTCGFNATNCVNNANLVQLESAGGLVLNNQQIDGLIEGRVKNTTSASAPSPTARRGQEAETCYMDGQRMYNSATVLAIGLGMGFPLAIAVVACVVMFRKIRAMKPKTMYDPPDEPPVPMVPRALSSRPSTSSLGRTPTIHTVHSTHTLHEPATMPRSFLDRYATNKSKESEAPEVHEIDMGNPRYELGSTQAKKSDENAPAELKGTQPGEGWKKVMQEPIGY